MNHPPIASVCSQKSAGTGISVRSALRRLAHLAPTGLVVSMALCGSHSAIAANGSWTLNNSGNWSLGTNWAGGTIADGQGSVADFTTPNITSNRTVTIDTTSRTVGVLRIGDMDGSHRYIVAASGGARLIFDNGVSAAQLNVIGTSFGDNITAPISLNSSLDINNASAGLVTISGGVMGNAAGTMTITNKSTGSGGVTIGAGVISDGSGVIALHQNSETSILTLTAATNTYSGGTTITAGTLAVSGNGALGTGTLTFAGGVLNMNAAPANNIHVADNTASTLNVLGQSRNLGTLTTGSFTGKGTLNINLNGFTLTERSPLTNFEGTINLGLSGAGSVLLLATDNVGSSSATFDLGTGSAILRGSDAVSTPKTINLGALKGGANTILEGASTNGVTTDTFVIGANGLSTSFDGMIRNGQGSPNAHVVAVVKTGTGTLTLGGTNTYTGTTTIRGGTLLISGSLTSTASTLVEHGVLAGSGSISSSVTIGDDLGASGSAILAPGSDGTIGILKTGALSLNKSDAAFKFDLQTLGGLQNDLVQVTGTVTLGMGLAQLIGTDLLTAALGENTIVTLITATGNITGYFAGLTEQSLFTVGANTYRISYGVEVANAITLTTVPEPGTWAMLTASLGVLLGFQRLRKASQS